MADTVVVSEHAQRVSIGDKINPCRNDGPPTHVVCIKPPTRHTLRKCATPTPGGNNTHLFSACVSKHRRHAFCSLQLLAETGFVVCGNDQPNADGRKPQQVLEMASNM